MTRKLPLATALLFGLSGVAPAIAAPPLPLVLEAFEVHNEEWVEDFASGELKDGSPSPLGLVPYHWHSPETFEPSLGVFCGQALRVTEGALEVEGPQAACGGTTVSSSFWVTGDSAIRALYRLPTELEDFDAIGLGVSNPGATELLYLIWQRLDDFGGTFVQLLADPAFPIASLVAATPAAPPIGATHLELLLELQTVGFEVLPTGRFRFCTGLPCGGPYLPLSPNPGVVDGGALRAWEPQVAFLTTSRNGSTDGYVRQLEEFGVRSDAVEDFGDGLFPGRLGYFFFLDGIATCGLPGDAVESGGALHLLGTNPTCVEPSNPNIESAISLALGATTPGDLSGRARYRFEIPGRCQYYGLGVASGTVPPFDGVNLALFRSAHPGDPVGLPDLLAVGLFAESLEFPGILDGPSTPLVASAVVSTDPGEDPLLQEYVSIEFALDTADRVPTVSFRLCTAAGCPNDFTPLVPHTPSAFPNHRVCGIAAREFDPPFGPFASGRLQAENSVALAVTAGTLVPEPAAGCGVLAAIAALAACGAERSRRRRMA